IIRPAQRGLELRIPNSTDAEAARGKHHRGMDLLHVHRGQTLFNFGAGLAEGTTAISVVMLTGYKRCALISIGLWQIRSYIVVEIPRMSIGIQNFDCIAYFHDLLRGIQKLSPPLSVGCHRSAVGRHFGSRCRNS